MFTSCNPDGKLVLWEWDVDPKTREPIIPPKDKAELQALVSNSHLIFHNTKFDVRALSTIGIKAPDFKNIDDTLIASHVLGSADSHGLKDLAIRHLDINDDDQSALQVATNEARRIGRSLGWRIAKEQDPHWPAIKTNNSGWWVNDTWLPRAVAKHKNYPKDHPWWSICSIYALRDAERTILLWELFKDGLEEEGLVEQYRTRLKLLEITYNMENRGVTVSHQKHKRTTISYKTTAHNAEKKCKKLATIDNLNSNQQLQKVLYGEFNLKTEKKTKTGLSTDKETCTALLDQATPGTPAHEFLTSLLDTRAYNKAVDYLQSYLQYGNPTNLSGYFRLHPAFNVTGTATTRFSSNWPNLQNVSKKEKTNIRQVFGPMPGREWYAMDYSNIEMRIFAYESGDKRLIEAFEQGFSVHLIFAEILFPNEYKACLKSGEEFKDKYESTLYQWTKNGNFSLIYGAGPGKANSTYHVPDAYNIIRKKLPLIDSFMSRKDKEAKSKGYITTLGGYRLQVPEKRPHVAVNYFVQGSAGWCMILAMIRVAEYLRSLRDHHLIMTIHDELDYDFPIQKNLKNVYHCKQLMESSGKDIGLPTPVDVERHADNWAKGERIKTWSLSSPIK